MQQLIREATTAEDVATARGLMTEYARGLGIDLCFQGFERELAQLPGDYAPPRGCLLVTWRGDEATGVVALRPLDAGRCEMKRLYVCPVHRGAGVGRALVEAVIAAARAKGYDSMVLDTLASMTEARSLYRALGFLETTPYTFNPVPGATYLELRL